MDDHGLTDAPPLVNVVPGATPAPVPSAALAPAPVWVQVVRLAWPTLVQQLLVFAVSLFDSLLAGRFQTVGGAEQLASQGAQTTANYLAWFISSCTVLVSVGATALTARLIGARKRRAAAYAANQSLLLAFVLGLVGGALGYFGLPLILWLLQLRGESATFAAAYLRPMFGLLVFQIVEQAGVACLVGAGDTLTGLLVLGGVAVINVPLTWIFFEGAGPLPGLGFAGIGLGTAVAHALGGLAVVGVLVRGRAGLQLRLRLLKPYAHLLARLLRVSVPAFLDSVSLALGHLWFLSIVNTFSDADKAAHGIAIRWESLSFLSGAAFGTAAMALVGQNLGAGRPARAARSGWTAFALGGGVMSFMALLFFVFAPQMFGLFCPRPEQAAIIAVGVPVLRLVALAQPALASTNIFTASLRGAGDTRVPVLFTWFGFFAVRIPLAYVLTFDHLDLGPFGVWPGCNFGLLGAWMAMLVDLLVRGMLVLGRFAGGQWQRMRV